MPSTTTKSAVHPHPLHVIIPTNNSTAPPPPAHANGSMTDGITPLDDGTPRHAHAPFALPHDDDEQQPQRTFGFGLGTESVLHPKADGTITHPHPGLHVVEASPGDAPHHAHILDIWGHGHIGLFRLPAGSPVNTLSPSSFSFASSPTTSKRPSVRVARRNSLFTAAAADGGEGAESHAHAAGPGLPPMVETSEPSSMELDGALDHTAATEANNQLSRSA